MDKKEEKEDEKKEQVEFKKYAAQRAKADLKMETIPRLYIGKSEK